MEHESQFQLLRKKRFAPYFATQFLGAFNDNVYKNSLTIIIAFQAADISADQANTLINLAAGLFILPFFLFSASAGQLADKYEKSALVRRIKLLEIAIMLCAAIAFYLESIPALFVLLFFMGAQSSFFGPVKYGILPQHLKEKELTGGNGLVEMGTFVSILFGNIVGEKLIGIDNFGIYIISAVLVAVAVLGYFASTQIPAAPATDPELKINWNLFSETGRMMKFAKQNSAVFNSILGISWFWFLGATYLAQLPNFTKLNLGADPSVFTLLLATFSVGIATGSLLCERLSGRRIEPGLVPIGAFGLTVFGADLVFAHAHSGAPQLIDALTFAQTWPGMHVLIDILLIGLSGGFFIVPLYALIQQRSEASHRSRIIASNNILNALFMVVSAVTAITLLGMGLSIPDLFLVVAVMNVVVAVYIFTLVPEFIMRFLVWLLVHSLYRVDKHGLEKIPEQGGAILVCNHVSFVDALILAGCIRRPVRFVMYYKIFQIPVLSFIFKTAKAVPIAGKQENPKMLEDAYGKIAAALEDGELVCIFPEGKITQNGEMNTFRPGVENILQRTPVPVIPLALRGLWGTFFSREGGVAMAKLPRSWMKKITLATGDTIAPEKAKAPLLQEVVLALRGEHR